MYLRIKGVHWRLFGIVVLSSGAASLLIGFLILKLGMIQFGGMDGGVVTNSAWMISRGAIPYKDFLTAVPPAFIIGGSLAFKMFGPTWKALVQFTAVFAIITFLLHSWLLRKLGLSFLYASCLAFSCIALTWIPISWWWYNQMTSSFIILYLTCASVFAVKPDEKCVNIAFVLLASLVILSKVNLALLAILVGTVVAMTGGQKKKAMFLTITAIILATAFVLAMGVDFGDVANCYKDASARASDWTFLTGQVERMATKEARASLVIYFLGLCAFMTSLLTEMKKQSWKERKWALVYPVGSIFLSLVGLMTNNDHRSVECAIGLSGLGAFLIKNKDGIIYKMITAIICISFSFHCLRLALQRTRIEAIGPNLFYEKETLQKVPDEGFFQGLEAGPIFFQVYNQIQGLNEVIKNLNVGDGEIFFGPRIDWGYALLGVCPPNGLPLWWESYQSNHDERIQSAMKMFTEQKVKVCVFLPGDFTFMPQHIIELIQNNYNLVPADKIRVFVAKKASCQGLPE